MKQEEQKTISEDGLTQEETYNALMGYFIPYGDYAVKDYYGVSLIKMKKNGKFSIKLIYDYSNTSKTSNPLEIDDVETALDIYRVLNKFAKDKSDKIVLKDILLKAKKDKDVAEW